MPDNTTLTTAGTLSAKASKRLAAIQLTSRAPTPRTRYEPPKS